MKCPECGKDIYPKVLPHCEGAVFKTPLLDEMETDKAWPCFVISGSGINDPLVAVNKKELDTLRAERDELKEDIKGLQLVFDLGRLRTKEASAHWRAAKGKPSTVWPDLGDLLTWLMAEAGLEAGKKIEADKKGQPYEELSKQFKASYSPAGAPAGQIPLVASNAQLYDACLSYRHDFGLMDEKERRQLLQQASSWLKVWRHTILFGASAASIKMMKESDMDFFNSKVGDESEDHH